MTRLWRRWWTRWFGVADTWPDGHPIGCKMTAPVPRGDLTGIARHWREVAGGR